MSSHDTGNFETSEHVRQLIQKTQLCKPCSSLFGRHPSQTHIHHESYASLCQSWEGGCQLCAILKERWDFEAAKQVDDAEWHSTAHREPEFSEHIDICICPPGEERSVSEMLFEIRPYEHEFPSPPSNKEYIHTALQWFGSCTGTTHPLCNKYRKQHDRRLSRPSRLLYFPSGQTEKVQLVEVQPERIYRYATLSHRWGAPEPLKLSCSSDGNRKISYIAMIKGTSTSDLPRIFRDALQIIHHCKLEYLWIDSLCINQDIDIYGRNGDWEREAVKIGDIYTGGVFNIAAVGSANSDGTLFPEQEDFFAMVTQDSFNDGPHKESSRIVRILPDSGEEFLRRVSSSELLSRGWVYQEVILAPANLFCTAQQMWWLCHKGRYCQNPLTTNQMEKNFQPSPYMTTGTLSKARKAIANPRGARGSLELWGELLRLYTKTSVTFKDDRLAAIAGLAKVFQSTFPRCVQHASYHSGVWSINVIYQLSWHMNSSSIIQKRHTADRYIPSWSPVSCKSEIMYPEDRERYVLPIECTMDTSELDDFGRGKSIEQCILHLRGVPIEMTLGFEHSEYEVSKVWYDVWPSSHPNLNFEALWDNQEELDLAAKGYLKNRLKALILTAFEPYAGSSEVGGILLRPFRDDNLTSPDKWVRCGYFQSLPYATRAISEAFKLTIRGITGVADGFYGPYLEQVSTSTEPNLEDIYIV